MSSWSFGFARILAVILAVSGWGRGEETERSVLVVQGEGTVRVEPDMAVVRVGVTCQKAVASEAQGAVNEVLSQVLTRVADLGIPAENVQTGSLSLSPIYGRKGEQEGSPAVVAYRATNVLIIQVMKLDRAGRVIDAALACGANELRSLSFQLRDSTEAERESLRIAARQAQGKAETIAAALGVTLQGIHRVRESEAHGGPRPLRTEMAAAAEAGTPVRPGQIDVRAVLEVEYHVDPRAAGARPE